MPAPEGTSGEFRAGSLGKVDFVKGERLDQQEQRDTSGAPRARCIPKLDRIQIVADAQRSHGLPHLNDFRTVRDTFVRQLDELRTLQGKASRPAMTLWSLLNYAILKRLFIFDEPVEVLLNEVLENHRQMARDATVASQSLRS
jgi:hypothetical protein